MSKNKVFKLIEDNDTDINVYIDNEWICDICDDENAYHVDNYFSICKSCLKSLYNLIKER